MGRDASRFLMSATGSRRRVQDPAPTPHPARPTSRRVLDTVDDLRAELDPSSPYAEASQIMLDFTKASLANGGDPVDVARAVVDAVADQDSQLHVHVGSDAAEFLDMWAETGSFESFVEAANAVVLSDDGQPG